MLALIDIDNFYVSCERLFRPDLVGRPVIVLSSNDGCVVARSQEAKLLKIKMGVPYFQIKNLVQKHQVQVFSSNYDLYQEMSNRLMNYIGQNFVDYEIYSIDECFVHCPAFLNQDKLQKQLQTLRHRIKQDLGLPATIGLSQTKTLAKLATELAKQDQSGFLFLSVQDRTHDLLFDHLPLQMIWGLGPASVRRLNQAKIMTVADFLAQKREFIQQLLGKNGVRVWAELQGTPSITHQQSSKMMQISRTFGHDITDELSLKAILTQFVQEIALKLRQSNLWAQSLSLFLATNYFQDQTKYYQASYSLRLSTPSHDDEVLLTQALKIWPQVFLSGQAYRKLGFSCYDLVAESFIKTDLFSHLKKSPKSTTILPQIDQLKTKYGTHIINLGLACAQNDAWKPLSTWRSPSYLSNWKQLPIAK